MTTYTDGPPRAHATTIIAVRKGGQVAMAGDGQVTIGDVVLKHTARKLRPLYQDRVLAGFAGAVADALTLFEKFEAQLERYRGNLRKAAVELTKEWRTDRYLRRLEAQLIVADSENLLLVSGEGDVIEPDEGVIAIGTGGPFALAAGMALLANTEMDAATVARKLLRCFEKPFPLDEDHPNGRHAVVTPSVGISIFPEDGNDAGALQRSADAAMYLVKLEGRNKFQFVMS